MGLLINGEWRDEWYDTKKTGGEFVREQARFHHWITPDGHPGPSGEGGFAAESGRYHLYVSLACPWAHRTLIFRQLKELKKHIGVSIVSPRMLEHGWEYPPNAKDGTADSVNGFRYHHQLYTASVPDYTGRATVPVLWDKMRRTIVNNESADIIRMFNSAFNRITGNTDDYYPADLRADIDTVNAVVYDNINNGVYRAGFATTQEAYEKAFHQLFETLGRLEIRLGRQRYLLGHRLTEADWRLFTTLIRFDSVYYSHFKTNLHRIEEYPNLSNYLRDLYQWPGIAQTVDFQQIKEHYYVSQRTINPTQIVPLGPKLDYHRSHNRSRFAHQ